MSTSKGKSGMPSPSKTPTPSEAADILAALEADKFAADMDDTLLYLDDLDPETCPPDTVYDMGDREAWVYEHGNVAELVFVRV